jgi:hypothetical protein
MKLETITYKIKIYLYVVIPRQGFSFKGNESRIVINNSLSYVGEREGQKWN